MAGGSDLPVPPVTALERDCIRAGRRRWEEYAPIVCKHLDIVISTPKDIKRIIKKQQGPIVIQKLVQCADTYGQEGRRNLRILGGILQVIRIILQDVVLSQDLFVDDLLDFVFGCLHPDAHGTSDYTSFRTFAIQVLCDLNAAARSVEAQYDLAIAGIATITRLIPRITKHGAVLAILLIVLQCNLKGLSAWQLRYDRPLPVTVLESLQLPTLARIIVGMLERNHLPSIVFEKELACVAEILHWISYYDSKAILDIHVGQTLLVAFMLSPSISIRCRGFLAMLNLYHVDYPLNLRLCNPQMIHRVREDPVPTAQTAISFIYWDDADPKSPDAILSSDKKYDVYETALQYVDYEINGPPTIDELYSPSILRTIGSVTVTFMDKVDGAFSARGNCYEALVFRLGITLFVILEMKAEGADPLSIENNYEGVRSFAQGSIEKWPDRAYFYYAIMKTRRGPECLEWGLKGLRCADCTPHLSRQIQFEMGVCQFSIGVGHLALDPHHTPPWREGVNYLKDAAETIKRTLAVLNPKSPEAQIMVILSFIVEHLLTDPRIHRVDAANLSEVREALSTLDRNRYLDHVELRCAIAEFVALRESASEKWASFISDMDNLDHLAVEKHRFNGVPESSQALKNVDYDRVLNEIQEQIESRRPHSRLPRCSTCQKNSAGLKKCGRCGTTMYCSSDCQTAHWVRGHKTECISPVIEV
ncbi:hypothetical protein SISNIDRAFT_452323 [Sistotremastrum niveocremeum HHB9708]|uniref:MYND-type domain-containing protein n=1 Tax=Sistotremastrum niveocremeum HHB9708 TaxID=1314777 RepID=A0A164X664_9AGAM|nr:hypothetical protein SISNIDRAFT_452323 [Sistotremastrum niveocremeum HHB9708]